MLLVTIIRVFGGRECVRLRLGELLIHWLRETRLSSELGLVLQCEKVLMMKRLTGDGSR